jgi:nucleoside-triphosphatase THEP1
MMDRWALIVGERGTGKSSLSSRVLAALATHGVAIAGVVQEAITVGESRVAYRALRAGGSDAVIVARKADGVVEHQGCYFLEDTAAFGEVRRWLAEDTRADGVVLIDEVSKFEVSGGGHHDAITAALKSGALVILSVREDQLADVTSSYELREPLASIGTSNAEDIDTFVSTILSVVRPR